MADAVESVCAALDPPLRLVEALVMAAARLHADDTTVPVLASGKTDTGDAGFTYGTPVFWGSRAAGGDVLFLAPTQAGTFPIGSRSRMGLLINDGAGRLIQRSPPGLQK
jgi:transposase